MVRFEHVAYRLNEVRATTKTMGLSRERWKASDHLYRPARSVPSKGITNLAG